MPASIVNVLLECKNYFGHTFLSCSIQCIEIVMYITMKGYIISQSFEHTYVSFDEGMKKNDRSVLHHDLP